MWYVIIFVLSAYSNSWAMNDVVKAEMSTKDMQRKSKPGEIKEDDLRSYYPYLVVEGEKSIMEDGTLWIDDKPEHSWNSWAQGN